MTPPRYQRIKGVFHAAMGAAPNDRERLLDADCAGDAGLRADVEGLLMEAVQANGFLEEPLIS